MRCQFLLGIFTIFCVVNLQAEGFRITPPGTFNLGRAGGRIAQVDDSSAVAQNPANLTDLTNVEAQATPGVIYYKANFDSSAVPGESAHTVDHWNLIPNAFLAVPMFDGKFAFGLGLSSPYGLAVHWDENSSAFAPVTGVFRYTTPYSVDLQTLNINPTIAMTLGDKLHVGIGLDVMWSEIELKQFYPWAAVTMNPASPDGNLHSDADGFGVGANLGVSFQITEHQRLAITYRSPIRVNYGGEFSVDNDPLVGGGVSQSSFNTSIKFPTIVAVGYGVELPHKVRLETDFEWVQFSNFKNLPINIGNPPPGLPTSVAENWDDDFTVGIGGDWQFADNWVLRAGYQFYKTPVPDSDLTPSIPDADENVFTIGLGYKHGHYSLEAAYGLDLYDTRNISNDQTLAFNGKYGVTAHLFSFAYRYSF